MRALRPFVGQRTDQVRVTGPTVWLEPAAALTMALLIHELATNASKYGALSTPDGHVRVSTEVIGPTLQLRWEESGGPTLSSPPTHSGFGTKLTELSIVQQLGGTIERDWRPEGVAVTCRVELARLVRSSPE